METPQWRLISPMRPYLEGVTAIINIYMTIFHDERYPAKLSERIAELNLPK